MFNYNYNYENGPGKNGDLKKEYGLTMFLNFDVSLHYY